MTKDRFKEEYIKYLIDDYRASHKKTTEFLSDEELMSAIPLSSIDDEAIEYSFKTFLKNNINEREKKILELNNEIKYDAERLDETSNFSFKAELRQDIRDAYYEIAVLESERQAFLEELDKMEESKEHGSR